MTRLSSRILANQRICRGPYVEPVRRSWMRRVAVALLLAAGGAACWAVWR